MIIKNKIWLVVILLSIVINIFLFWPGNLYFLNDDLLHIPLTDQGYLFQTNSIRPVHELLIRLELYVWNKNAYGYHITALLLHFIVCIQLYNLCFIIQVRWLKIARQPAIQAAFLSVVLFLIYPQSAECLGWILGRAPVLSAIFFMVTIRLFLVEKFKSTVYLAGALFFAITLFAYEQSIFAPAALLIIAFSEKQPARRQGMFKYVAALAMVAIAYVIVRKVVTSEVVGAYEGGNFLHMNIVTLLANFSRILFRLVLNPAPKATFIISGAILVLIAGFFVLRSKRYSINNNGLAFFFVMIILLVIPIISLGVAVNSFESGRYLYLPSIFLIGGISIISITAVNKYRELKVLLLFILIVVLLYWLKGKHDGARDYTDASLYAKNVELKIQKHFINSTDTLYLDTLHVTVHRLPVFRRGFKTGIKWLNNNVDTNKVVVRFFHDEVTHRELE